jgi:hypothetical protein
MGEEGWFTSFEKTESLEESSLFLPTQVNENTLE